MRRPESNWGCDAANLNELAKKSLDQVALSIDGRIDAPPDNAPGHLGMLGQTSRARDQIENGFAVVARSATVPADLPGTEVT